MTSQIDAATDPRPEHLRTGPQSTRGAWGNVTEFDNWVAVPANAAAWAEYEQARADAHAAELDQAFAAEITNAVGKFNATTSPARARGAIADVRQAQQDRHGGDLARGLDTSAMGPKMKAAFEAAIARFSEVARDPEHEFRAVAWRGLVDQFGVDVEG